MKQILLIAPSQAMIDIARKVCAEMGLTIPMEGVSSMQALEKTFQTYPETEVFIARGSMVGVIQRLFNSLRLLRKHQCHPGKNLRRNGTGIRRCNPK